MARGSGLSETEGLPGLERPKVQSYVYYSFRGSANILNLVFSLLKHISLRPMDDRLPSFPYLDACGLVAVFISHTFGLVSL